MERGNSNLCYSKNLLWLPTQLIPTTKLIKSRILYVILGQQIVELMTFLSAPKYHFRFISLVVYTLFLLPTFANMIILCKMMYNQKIWFFFSGSSEKRTSVRESKRNFHQFIFKIFYLIDAILQVEIFCSAFPTRGYTARSL